MISIESVKHLESFSRYGEVSNCFIKGLVVSDASVYAFTDCVLVDCKMHFVAVGLSFENCKVTRCSFDFVSGINSVYMRNSTIQYSTFSGTVAGMRFQDTKDGSVLFSNNTINSSNGVIIKSLLIDPMCKNLVINNKFKGILFREDYGVHKPSFYNNEVGSMMDFRNLLFRNLNNDAVRKLFISNNARNIYIQECYFAYCDFSNIPIDRFSFLGATPTTFYNCNLDGCDFSMKMEKLKFQDCTGNYKT